MRPAGEVRQALLLAAQDLHTPHQAPTLQELAARACVGYAAARMSVANMCRAGALQQVRTRVVAYRNRPVAEYVPVLPVKAAAAPCSLSDAFGRWAASAKSAESAT